MIHDHNHDYHHCFCRLLHAPYIDAGYHQSPSHWVKGTTPVPIEWMAGEQYDGDTASAAAVLSNLRSTFYPGAGKYEVAGFFWW